MKWRRKKEMCFSQLKAQADLMVSQRRCRVCLWTSEAAVILSRTVHVQLFVALCTSLCWRTSQSLLMCNVVLKQGPQLPPVEECSAELSNTSNPQFRRMQFYKACLLQQHRGAPWSHLKSQSAALLRLGLPSFSWSWISGQTFRFKVFTFPTDLLPVSQLSLSSDHLKFKLTMPALTKNHWHS